MAHDIGTWLDELGLGRYAPVFAENEVDLDTLPYLSENALEKMGVALGPRLKILAAVKTPAESRSPGENNETVDAETGPASQHAERRQLTVMFCDMVGSTAMSTALDPEEMRTVILAFQNAVAGEATRFEGHIAKYMGDGILIYFGWPRAHEDDAERAARAALSILQALSTLKISGGPPPQARIGIATGLVVVGDLIGEGASQEEAVVGETPNLAARLQGIAIPGQIVISQSTRNLLGALFEVEDLGEQTLKGMSSPTSAYSVKGARAFESRYDARATETGTRMVGREQELALLLERWKQAKTGEGQVVLLTGEAGIGKSRITRAVMDEIENDAHFRINYQCSPYHTDSALYPAIEQLNRAAKLAPGDDTEQKLEKLKTLLGQAANNYVGYLPVLARLLGIETQDEDSQVEFSPQMIRKQTLEALAGQLLGLSSQRPVLLVVEDAHWIDPTTLELIDQCLDRIASAPVFALITARPEFEYSFGGHSGVTRLALNRLGREQIAALVNRLSGSSPVIDELITEIVTKTDGVPLYVEELTKAVIESGETGIPASLHDSLMARLDRIPDVKEVAQVASTIGRVFDYRLLMAIANRTEPDLVACLEKLSQAELVFSRGQPPESTYTFKHALVRDAAYESLLKSRRQDLHRRIAEVLETQLQSTAELQPELLAHHYTEAGIYFEASEKWLAAGDRSARRAANREAVAQLRRGVGLLEHVEDGEARRRLELELTMTLGGCLRTLKGWNDDETTETVFKARHLCEKIANSPYRGEIGLGEYTVYLLRGELDKAIECGQELLRLSQDSLYGIQPYIGHRAAGATLFHAGRFEEAYQHLKAGLDIYDPRTEKEMVHKFGYYSGVTFHSYLSHSLWQFGYADRALESLERSAALTEELQHPPSQAFALFQAAFHHSNLMRNDPGALRDSITKYQKLAEEGGFYTWSAMVNSLQAVTDFEAGTVSGDNALEVVQTNLEWWKANAGILVIPNFYGLLATIQTRLGDVAGALSNIEAAMGVSDRYGEQYSLPELYRRKAELLASKEREDWLNKSLQASRELSSRSLELRTATDLARLWADSGDRHRATDLLAPVYDWFTEGFDTPDLKKAKSLLKEIE